MKKKWSSGLACVPGILLLTSGSMLMEKANFGGFDGRRAVLCDP